MLHYAIDKKVHQRNNVYILYNVTYSDSPVAVRAVMGRKGIAA